MVIIGGKSQQRKKNIIYNHIKYCDCTLPFHLHAVQYLQHALMASMNGYVCTSKSFFIYLSSHSTAMFVLKWRKWLKEYQRARQLPAGIERSKKLDGGKMALDKIAFVVWQQCDKIRRKTHSFTNKMKSYADKICRKDVAFNRSFPCIRFAMHLVHYKMYRYTIFVGYGPFLTVVWLRFDEQTACRSCSMITNLTPRSFLSSHFNVAYNICHTPVVQYLNI